MLLIYTTEFDQSLTFTETASSFFLTRRWMGWKKREMILGHPPLPHYTLLATTEPSSHPSKWFQFPSPPSYPDNKQWPVGL